MKILIAEDDLTSRMILEKIIKKDGYETIFAKDGQEAWELFQRNEFRIVVMDWMMPRMDGLTLCKKIRAANVPNYIYILMLTANNERESVLTGFEAGVDDYMAKPFDPGELKVRLRTGQRIIKLEDKHNTVYTQLLQSEKMASVGQLAAGVAHEINNPTGFVSSNLKTLSEYQKDIIGLLKQYKKLITDLKDLDAKGDLPSAITKHLEQIGSLETEVDVDFILADASDVIGDCREGTERIKKIVLALKDFAHPGEEKVEEADINKGIESTLNVVWNELKYKATITKDYGDLPRLECYPQQLNQVFMNILVNAAQAIEDSGEIRISTRADGECVEIKISDTGIGIPKEYLLKIFDPFFTTKEVGKGTGLGMNVAYNIIKKHKGTIAVESIVGKGTTFKIRIPTGEPLA